MSELLTTERMTRLRLLEDRPTGTLLVHEIYASIQGESTWTGLPCTFVRLAGCPLRCRWCDTPHAFSQGTPMSIAEVLRIVEGLAPTMVELTGGEPLAQREAFDLLAALADTGRQVLVETGGAVPIDAVDPRVVVILDIKCPGSGEASANRYENLQHLKPTDELKFVIADRTDFDWAIDLVQSRQLTRWPVLFSPVFRELSYQQLCEWILASGLPIRFQPQLHKHIWDPNARGV